MTEHDVSIYVRSGAAIVPTIYRVAGGPSTIREPVDVIPLEDAISITRVLYGRLSVGVIRLERATDEFNSLRDVRKFVKVRSWKEFERGTLSVTVAKDKDSFFFLLWKKSKYGRGWGGDSDIIERMPVDASLEEVARIATEKIIAYAKNPPPNSVW